MQLKRALGRVGQLLGRPGPRRVILLYHSIGDSPWALKAEAFQAQVEWLQNNTRIVSLESLLGENETDGLAVSITFDDGYASLVHAAEILSGANAVATAYLNSGLIGDNQHHRSDILQGHYPEEQFMTWSEVEILRARGWAIGSHGVEHLDLTNIPAGKVTGELVDSKSEIESRLGTPCDHFSYTWGRQNRGLRDAVKSAGYKTAVTGIHGPVKPGCDPLSIPRINVHNDYSIEDFAAILRGSWDYLGLVQRLRNR